MMQYWWSQKPIDKILHVTSPWLMPELLEPVNLTRLDRGRAMEANKECRICLEDEVAVDDEWLSPCRCNGSMKWVHRSCLGHWRELAPTLEGKRVCPTCK